MGAAAIPILIGTAIGGGVAAATGAFSKPKIPSPPPVKPTARPPEKEVEGATKFQKPRKGLPQTLLTGTLEPSSSKKTALGE